MNAFTMIARMKKEAHKDAMRAEKLGMNYEEYKAKRIEQLWADNMDTFILAQKFQHEARKRCVELGIVDDNKLKQTFFITVRPDETSIKFYDFYIQVMKFIKRKAISSYELTFEQKGESEEDIGKGFHFHAIVKTIGSSWRSKGEVLRDTQSTFKNCTSANCIEVDILHTKDDYNNVHKYITDYTSSDGHKEPTYETDVIWRTQNSLSTLYTKGSILPVLSSPSVPAVEQGYTVSLAP